MNAFFSHADSFHMKLHVFICTIGFIIGFGLFAFVYNYEDIVEYKWTLYAIAGVLSIATFYVIRAWSVTLDKKINWSERIGYRLLAGSLLSYILSIIVSFGLAKIYNLVTSHGTDEVYIKLSILLLLLCIVGNVVYLIFYSYNQYNKKNLRSVQFEREQINFQLEALKAQISPHFLFNNLNTISYLIGEDTTKAKSYIRKMANCYAYILESYKKVLVSLKEEIAFIDAFQFLIQTRHNDAIIIQNTLSEDDLKSKVPSVSIQLLVENAVKHNDASKENPLEIKISADTESIIVSNEKRTKSTTRKSTKIGLKNIIGRYKLLSSKSVEIKDGKLFTVKLPKIH